MSIHDTSRGSHGVIHEIATGEKYMKFSQQLQNNRQGVAPPLFKGAVDRGLRGRTKECSGRVQELEGQTIGRFGGMV